MKLSRTAFRILGATFIVSSFTAACGDDTATNDGGAGDRNGPDPSSGDDAPAPTGPTCSEPGGRECTGSASGIVCAEGSTTAFAFTCATGEVCEDGNCVGQCEGGATECVGESVMRICADDGREWVSVACADGTTCQDGACLLPGGLVCTPGEKSCDGPGTTRTCKDDGSGYEEAECPADTECTEGGCRGSVCTIGDTKCDDSASEWVYDWFEYGSEPNLSVVYTCVDGSAWVPSPCATDGETSEYCSYNNLNRADVAAFEAAVAGYSLAYQDWENAWEDYYLNEGPQPSDQPPPAPTFGVPEAATAECVQTDCGDWFWGETSYFIEYTADERRGCGDSDDEAPAYAGWTTCVGFPPYQAPDFVEQSCGDSAICTTNYNGETWTTACEGLTPDADAPLSGDCYPGESVCTGPSSYQYCYYDGDGSYWSGESSTCPGEVPTACADSSTFPSREASCGGTPVSTLPL